MPPKVRDAIRLEREQGWQLNRTRGIHRQYTHASKPGVVTIAGHPQEDIHPRTWASIPNQMGLR